jgi:hypothetical protein
MNHDRIMSEAKRRRAIIPAQNSQCYELLKSFFDGKKFTVLKALDKHGIYALSQRCGELKNKYRWPVKAHWKTLSNGKKVKEYSL